MKFFVYLISVILIVALIGLFFLKKPDGQPWLSPAEITLSSVTINEAIDAFVDNALTTYKDITNQNELKIEQNDDVKIYRWKDSKGHWNYSDKPRLSAESEQVLIEPSNIITLPPIKAIATESLEPRKKDNKPLPSPLTISPAKVLDLYKDAKNVQKVADERQTHINKTINGSDD